MTAPRLEHLHDVMSYEIGVAHQGGEPAIALRFLLRDGASFAVAIQADLATGIALQIMEHLKVAAEAPPPTRN